MPLLQSFKCIVKERERGKEGCEQRWKGVNEGYNRRIIRLLILVYCSGFMLELKRCWKSACLLLPESFM